MSPAKNRQVSILVVTPTRELAMQVHAVFDLIGSNLPVKPKCLAVYGGVSINPQMIALQGTDILIATPGRLLELTASNAVSLKAVQILVLDEADKMLNPEFRVEMARVFDQLPAKRQTLLFSATLSSDVSNFRNDLLHHPEIIRIEQEIGGLELTELTAYLIPEEKKGPLLRYIIKSLDIRQVLVFTSSVHRADAVAAKLYSNGIEAVAIHSKKSQESRTSALRLFKSGEIQVLVATDLISRGIDIKYLPYVINYELPRSPKDFIHRIGRTGRAEAPGEAISFVTPEDEAHFRIIQKKTGRIATLIDGKSINLQGY
jgi:ATP-dependent RNA helicase RhlE